MINFFSETTFDLGGRLEPTKKWLTAVAQIHSFEIGELTIIFCDDAYLLRINQEYLNHDDYTDIITFDYTVGKSLGGDVFISIERVTENAQTFNVQFEQELGRVLAHGLLHLIGFQDKSEAHQQDMRKEEERALSLASCPF
jgi:probable rRNA maturation factor